jgi:hypothetical protein
MTTRVDAVDRGTDKYANTELIANPLHVTIELSNETNSTRDVKDFDGTVEAILNVPGLRLSIDIRHILSTARTTH